MKTKVKKFLPEMALIFALAISTLWAVNAIAFEGQSSRGNGVRVDVEPVQLVPGKQAIFKVIMNTHSVALTQDLLAVSALTDERGRKYRAEKWEGPGPGGHHRSGVLSFAELEGNPGTVTLIISDVAGIKARAFTWPVE